MRVNALIFFYSSTLLRAIYLIVCVPVSVLETANTALNLFETSRMRVPQVQQDSSEGKNVLNP